MECGLAGGAVRDQGDGGFVAGGVVVGDAEGPGAVFAHGADDEEDGGADEG